MVEQQFKGFVVLQCMDMHKVNVYMYMYVHKHVHATHYVFSIAP